MPRNFIPERVFEDARIIFRNFAGVAMKFNAEGNRNFCLKLDPLDALEMEREGWTIKYLKPREEDEGPQAYLKVKVSFKIKTPTIVLITGQGDKKRRTTIPEELLTLVDHADIKELDVSISPSPWEMDGRSGVTAYLKSIFITLNEDPLVIKYADIPEIGDGSEEQMALEGSLAYDYEGEVVEEAYQRALES